MLYGNIKILGSTLLSAEEAENLLTKENRKYHCWWWLRSPGDYSSYAASVYVDGDVYYYGGGVNYDGHCVRPALKISNLESSNLLIGDVFEVGDWKFKVISENLAWMYEQDIGDHIFDAKTNVYEQSEIKQFVDNWFEKEIKPLIPKELDFSKVKFEETIGDISYFIVPREWVEDYALSDVFATISLEDDIVRISPTKYDGEQYVDYDWRDFFVLPENIIKFKNLASKEEVYVVNC